MEKNCQNQFSKAENVKTVKLKLPKALKQGFRCGSCEVETLKCSKTKLEMLILPKEKAGTKQKMWILWSQNSKMQWNLAENA